MIPPSAIAPPTAPFAGGGAEYCPLCGGHNECGLTASATGENRCWCDSVCIPDELLARVPMEFRGRACLCRDCVTAFHQEREGRPSSLATGDFYFERGLMVLSAAYLQRRGYCCHNNCRHCPYREERA